jgi:hypothetical protein
MGLSYLLTAPGSESIYHKPLDSEERLLALLRGTRRNHTNRAFDMEVMREAMSDPLLLADLEEVAEDFKCADAGVQ